MKESKPAYLRRLVREGRTPSEVAAVANVSERTVYRACKGMDIKLIHEYINSTTNWSLSSFITKIHRLYDIPYIAKVLGVSVQYVYQVIEQKKAS
jgi:transposase